MHMVRRATTPKVQSKAQFSFIDRSSLLEKGNSTNSSSRRQFNELVVERQRNEREKFTGLLPSFDRWRKILDRLLLCNVAVGQYHSSITLSIREPGHFTSFLAAPFGPMILREQAKHNRRILTCPTICTRHNVSTEGCLLPSAAGILRFQFHQTLQCISFETSSQRTVPFTFERRVTVPFTAFTDACMGFYSPDGNETQKTLDDTSCRAGVDPSRALTLFFSHLTTQLKPIYLEMSSREVAFQYLKALLWLKSFLSSRGHSPTTNPHLRPLDNIRHELLSFRDRMSKPTAVYMEWKMNSNTIDSTIDITPRQGRDVIERFPVAAIEAIHCGRQSDIFGLMKWVFSLRFKDPRFRSVHFALPDRNRLKDLTESLRCLANIERCVSPTVQLSADDDRDSFFYQSVARLNRIHALSPRPKPKGLSREMTERSVQSASCPSSPRDHVKRLFGHVKEKPSSVGLILIMSTFTLLVPSQLHQPQ
eukprot:g37636.t1